MFVPILWDRQRIRLPRSVFHSRFCQAARQIPVEPIQREIKSILDVVAELVTEISKKDFCVLTAMLTKALALGTQSRQIHRTALPPRRRSCRHARSRNFPLQAGLGMAPHRIR